MTSLASGPLIVPGPLYRCRNPLLYIVHENTEFFHDDDANSVRFLIRIKIQTDDGAHVMTAVKLNFVNITPKTQKYNTFQLDFLSSLH